jgi:acetolactate synthase-1/3 small subunit
MRERTIEMWVRSHAYVLVHVAGLVARRGYRLVALTCDPPDARGRSRIVLTVADEGRVELLVSQLARLHDVVEIAARGTPPTSGG